MANHGHLRIGALSRRVGISPELLRAWEARYGLLQPDRTPSGYRLYSIEDEARVRMMKGYIEQGLAASDAARLALAAPLAPSPADTSPAAQRAAGDFDALTGELRGALSAFDEEAAQDALDRLLASFSVEKVLRDALLVLLHELGDRWAAGAATVAEEHFASNVLRGRLMAMARGWDQGNGPRALLACPPDEYHDISLIMFGALHRRGWRVTFFGPHTPGSSVVNASRMLLPELAVLYSPVTERFSALGTDTRDLPRSTMLCLAGDGASAAEAKRLGARVLGGDPISAAAAVTLQFRRG